MKASWMNPPPIVFVGGGETFLRDREIKKAKSAAWSTKRRVVKVTTDSEVSDELNVTRTFGEPVLIIYDRGGKIPSESVRKEVLGVTESCLLVVLDGDGSDISNSDTTLKIIFSLATSRKDRKDAASKFVAQESKILGTPLSDPKLADSLVDIVGEDLGYLSFEVAKASALARSKNLNQISTEILRSTVRAAAGADLSPLTESLAYRDSVGVAKALIRIKSAVSDDPSMLLLRAKSGPAETSLTWIKLASFLEQGVGEEEAAQRSGLPLWLARRTAIPAARNWGLQGLQRLSRRLSEVDRGILAGTIQTPWAACEAALIGACCIGPKGGGS